MEVSQAKDENPLGLSLDFMFGRGYLWAKSEEVSDWISIDQLRMEIPDLSFPFDARDGLERFRQTRCLVRDISMSISEVGLRDLLRQAASHIQGFDDLQIHFLDGAAHVSLRLRAFGADTFLSFRVALIPPEPAQSDEVHLSLYDYRAYGPLPYPARLFAAELTTRMLQTPVLRPPGRGESFTVGIAGDVLRLRPLKLLLLQVFPKSGWKLPDLSSVVLKDIVIRPGGLTLRACSADARWVALEEESAPGVSAESASALAAYTAKDVYARADESLFASDVTSAIAGFEDLRGRFGLDSELAGRILDCLLADPSPTNIIEAEEICSELAAVDKSDIRVLMARPGIALLSGRREDMIASFEVLSAHLQSQGDIREWTLCELAIAQYLEAEDALKAEERLRGILRVAPHNCATLERLRALYMENGKFTELEDILKRLTGVYSDRERLTETYLALANLLMEHGNANESRAYLERVLRLDSTRIEALDTLGENYVMAADPLRALKAFGTAARAAESQGDRLHAGRLHFRIARIWETIGDFQQALLSSRRGLSLRTSGVHEGKDVGDEIEELEFAARMCRECGREVEAVGYWVDVVALLRSAIDRVRHIGSSQAAGFTYFGSEAGAHEYLLDIDQMEAKLVEVHRKVADSYETQGRADAAGEALRQLLEIAPQDSTALAHLERFWSDEPMRLLGLYRALLATQIDHDLRVELHLRAIRVGLAGGDIISARDHVAEVLHDTSTDGTLRQQLIEVLIENERYETLRELLNQQLVRTKDRKVRKQLLVDLAHLQRRYLAEPTEAIVNLVEAIGISEVDVELVSETIGLLEEYGTDEKDFMLGAVGMRSTEVLDLLRTWVDSPDANDEEVLHNLLSLEEKTDHPHPIAADSFAETTAQQNEASSVEVEEDHASIEAFRVELEASAKAEHSVPALGALEPGSSMAKILGAEVSEPSEPSSLEELVSAAELKSEIEAARVVSDYELLASQMGRLLNADAEGRLDRALESDQRLQFHRELGEVLYYELDDWSLSLKHLEYVYQGDPDGLGADPAVVNALESIYEDTDNAEGKLGVLENKFRHADTPAMQTVYRLLIAQSAWEFNADDARVYEWIQPILAADPNHEGAHRLLSEIALQRERYDDAVQHLKTVLSVTAGGLDAVETAKQVADVLLNRLDQPRKALRYFRNVLADAPGDSRALEGVKNCQAKLGDWDGLIQSLSIELGLLIGRAELQPRDITDIDASQVTLSLRIAASQIVADIGHVVESEIRDIEWARAFWKTARRLWPEHAEALERSIELGKQLGHFEEVCEELVAYADMLLDTDARFGALVECAAFRLHKLDQPEQARSLLAEALALVDNEEVRPQDYDEVRRQFQALS